MESLVKDIKIFLELIYKFIKEKEFRVSIDDMPIPERPLIASVVIDEEENEFVENKVEDVSHVMVDLSSPSYSFK